MSLTEITLIMTTLHSGVPDVLCMLVHWNGTWSRPIINVIRYTCAFSVMIFHGVLVTMSAVKKVYGSCCGRVNDSTLAIINVYFMYF